jgi:hypothetical protein
MYRTLFISESECVILATQWYAKSFCVCLAKIWVCFQAWIANTCAHNSSRRSSVSIGRASSWQRQRFPWLNLKCHLKGTVAGDFLSKVISPKVPNCSSDSWYKAVSNIDSYSPRYSTFKVLTCYGLMRRIWLCAMGHCGRFSYALWAIAADLVMHYGPLRQICWGHCCWLGYKLWASKNR